MIKTLTNHPYAQCKIIINDNTTACKSYNTIVAIIENGWLIINGLYSATTRKHIGEFVKEYADINYQIAKRLYNDGYKYNIYTGEICPV